ncbi:protein of unknown function [Pseudodesulfovibrio profundus]|uniref:Methyltransferase type 11 domain-containing protein n=1 Tax=Pseudodesulfovibrio profundus TaxID=57320 RepID=A0A2C8FC69_9BACT|nr:methyltransferase domain-containing protein [Pseudodesulfovibrio profundus]SOB60083.1 protein of unknown function [Pseudodesulfovibrio profundus]
MSKEHTTTKDSQQSSIDLASALIKRGELVQARDLLSRRIINAPDDYKARLLLRESFLQPGTDSDHGTGEKSCPCCNNSFSFFLPGGPSFRPDACCPACESLERHRFLCLILERLLPATTADASMIHVAPEQSLSPILREKLNNRYFTIDRFADADIQCDLCLMPFGTDSIELFMANHVLEHVKDDRLAMREIRRILKPKGRALLQVPLDHTLSTTQEAPEGATHEDLLRLFGQDDHVRQYGTDFKDRLEQSGFTVREHTCFNTVTPKDIKTYGLHKDEIVWEAIKA